MRETLALLRMEMMEHDRAVRRRVVEHQPQSRRAIPRDSGPAHDLDQPARVQADDEQNLRRDAGSVDRHIVRQVPQAANVRRTASRSSAVGWSSAASTTLGMATGRSGPW